MSYSLYRLTYNSKNHIFTVPMPKSASKQNALQKSKRYMRTCLKSGTQSMIFTNYDSKQSCIYKLNKYHYYNPNIDVIDLDTITYMAQLFKNPNKVVSIQMDLCNLDDQCLVQFSKANWQNVKFLNLTNNKIAKRGVKSLVNGKFAQLTDLSLSDNSLNQQSMCELVTARWAKLQKLNLSFNNITGNGLRNFEKSQLKKLKELNLINCNIDNQGLDWLSRIFFPQMSKLQLSNNLITNDGMKLLVRCQWRLLKILDLDGNFITDQGLRRLAKINSYQLQKLQIFATKTMIVNKSSSIARVFPTMTGVAQLSRASFEHLTIQIHQGGVGHGRDKFIYNTKIKEMLFYAKRNINFIK